MIQRFQMSAEKQEKKGEANYYWQRSIERERVDRRQSEVVVSASVAKIG